MATPSIDTYEFLSMIGPALGPAAETVEDISRAGLDGHAYRKVGKRSEPVQLMTIKDVLNAAAAKTLIENYLACQGTLADVTDAHGNETTDVCVLRVGDFRVSEFKTGVGMTSDTNTLLVRALWTLQPAGA